MLLVVLAVVLVVVLLLLPVLLLLCLLMLLTWYIRYMLPLGGRSLGQRHTAPQRTTGDTLYHTPPIELDRTQRSTRSYSSAKQLRLRGIALAPGAWKHGKIALPYPSSHTHTHRYVRKYKGTFIFNNIMLTILTYTDGEVYVALRAVLGDETYRFETEKQQPRVALSHPICNT